MKIICISGKAGHGKDTAAQFLKDQLELKCSNVLIAHFGDLVKYVCKTFFGWDGQKNKAGREMLQTVGTDIVRHKDPDYWVRFIADMLKFFEHTWDYVIIADTRFLTEIKYLTDHGFDVIHIRIIRDEYLSDMPIEQQNHESEIDLDDYFPDIYIHNNGYLGDFYDSLVVAVNELKL